MKLHIIFSLLAITALAACQKSVDHPTQRSNLHNASYTQSPSTPKVTGILVKKKQGQMILVSNGQKVKTYDIDLGFSPTGGKQIEGDGKTPEGTYYIDRKNPQSQFYRSLGISYPNAADINNARSVGQSPGGDIFIHGQGRWGRGRTGTNWTRGCIALTDLEAREIYAMVDVGTPITILP